MPPPVNNPPNVSAPRGIVRNPFARPSAAKYARNQKKKERQEQIGSQSMGEVEDIPKTNSDTAGRNNTRLMPGNYWNFWLRSV